MTTDEIQNALSWYNKHRNYVNGLVNGVSKFPPSLKEDKRDCQLWKPQHWKWFLGYNCWQVGNEIHFWFGNPRNTRGKRKPYHFALGKCSRVETIIMEFGSDMVYIGNDIVLKSDNCLKALAENEGLDNWAQMKLWFDNPERQLIGKIIFFKNVETL